MLKDLLPALLVVAIMFIVGFTSLWIARRKQRDRRSPLTHQLLRSPGESLRRQVDQLTDEVNDCLLLSILVPLAISISFLLQNKINTTASLLTIMLYISTGGVFSVYLIQKMVRLLNGRNKLRVGLDAELAVGQELNQLMRDGYHVFHDFPADRFNIDHVVIGPSGVYAVETKGRAKPLRGGGKDDANVVFDGKGLQFPGWYEKEPIEQTERQAKWLGQWLSKAVGDAVNVSGVLALPGWYVTRKGAGSSMVIMSNSIEK